MTARDFRRRSFVSTLALMAALDLSANARPARAQEPDSDATAASKHELSEVVVTASRRQSTALSTPIDISALTSSDLQREGVKDFKDLTRVVPGLVYNSVSIRDGGATNSFILHGLNLDSLSGDGGDTPLADVPPVSVYVDETPTFVNLHLADVQRVEVLRGPQATLYGDSSIAGTVRVLFNQPDLTKQSAEISGDVGGTHHADGPNYSFDAVINQPITDYLGVRLAAGYTFENGFIDAPYLFQTTSNHKPILADPSDPSTSIPLSTSKKDVDDSDLYYFRPMVLFQKDKFKLLFTYQHQHEWSQGPDQDSYPGGPSPTSYSTSGDVGATPPFPTTTPTSFDSAFPSKFSQYQTGDFILQPLTRNVDLGSVEASYDLGFATLTSVTSGFNTQSNSVDDSSGFYQKTLGFFYDGYPRLLLYSTRAFRDYAFTQEIRLVSKIQGPFSYSLGFFYDQDRNHLRQEDNLEGYSDYPAAFFGSGPTDLGYVDDRTIKFQDLAGFGELTYHVTPAWQVTGGVRVFRQQADIQSIIELPICGIDCDSAPGSTSPLGIAVGSEKEVTKKALMKFNTSYEFAPHFLSYFTYSQGERRGGANGTPTLGNFAESPVFQFYQPDTVDNYELGIKGRVGGRFEFSSAFYWVVWHNPQVQVSTPDGSFPAIVNGKGARSRGVDLEGRYKLTDQITLSGTYGYVEADLTAPISVAPTFNTNGTVFTKGASYGNVGTRLPGTPTHTASIGADYATTVMNDVSFDGHVDLSYRSGMTTDLSTNVNQNLDGFASLNASVMFNKGPLRAGLYADNITNTRGVLGAENPDEYDVRARNNRLSRPLTVGLRFGYKYN